MFGRPDVYFEACQLKAQQGMESGRGRNYSSRWIYSVASGDSVTIELYDTQTDVWKIVYDQRISRNCISFAINDGQVYLIGGGGRPAIGTRSTKIVRSLLSCIHGAPMLDRFWFFVWSTGRGIIVEHHAITCSSANAIQAKKSFSYHNRLKYLCNRRH